jgi:DUF2924 family protein
MPPNLASEMAALPRLGVSELRAKFAIVFGEATPSHNKTWLIKRIAWRLQAQAEGDLSERARRRAAELVADTDLRLSAPRAEPTTSGSTPALVPALRMPADARLRPGTVLTRRYKGRTLQVEVLEHGFAWEGQTYRSLSALAKAVTGSHCSGHFFFGLAEKGPKP